MKTLRICLGLCAVAMCLSAFAQRPPKGYNYAYGDFNGDGKKEYVYFIPPKGADRWEELDDFESLYGVLKFTNPSIPSIKVKQCVSGVPRNLGDLNGDGKDEIGIQPGWVTSSWQVYRIFTLKRTGWIDAVPSFTVWLGDEDTNFDTNPPVKKLGNGKVRITTYEWQDGDVVKKYKTVKVK